MRFRRAVLICVLVPACALLGAAGSAWSTTGSLTLFHFDGNDAPTWVTVNDGVMGGVSTSRTTIANGTLTFAGRVRLENNGGFASTRARLDGLFDEPLRTGRSVTVRVRGDGRRYQVTMQAADRSAWFWATIEPAAGRWTTIDLPYAAFRPHGRFGEPLAGVSYDGRVVESLGFLITNKRAERFRLDVDSIGVHS